MIYPNMMKITQQVIGPEIRDIEGEIINEMECIQVKEIIQPGESIAITVGSRGIAGIDIAIKTLSEYLKGVGALPFIVPAMGSHGGGTAEGQRDILTHYGITEEAMGVPIRSSMDVVQIATTPGGIMVFMDKYASEADRIIVVNRIKPHTDYSGDTESGMIKMMAAGLGKKIGADYYHKATIQHGYGHVMSSVGCTVLKNARIAFGLGLVENSNHRLAYISAVRPENLEKAEKDLLLYARQYLAKIPFGKLDVLIIDEIGKDISGIGMDSNVIGRALTEEKRINRPVIKRIFIRDLSKNTRGNANGVGLADFVTQRLVDKIDYQATYLNCLTGMFPEAGRIPMTFKRDSDAIGACLSTIGHISPEKSKIVWIKNTSVLDVMVVSEEFRKEVQKKPELELIEEMDPLAFDMEGNLLNLF